MYGFANIETRSVEPTHVLTGNGDDKEIYVLARLHEEAGPIKSPAELGLRFDLTVPTARYVQQFRGQLSFPFKRYQMQKVWRGERPQEGRYREFMQCDIDVIGDVAIYDDSQETGIVAVEILVDKYGKIIKAEPVLMGSTTTSSILWKKAKDGLINKILFNESAKGEEARGTIYINFTVR